MPINGGVQTRLPPFADRHRTSSICEQHGGYLGVLFAVDHDANRNFYVILHRPFLRYCFHQLLPAHQLTLVRRLVGEEPPYIGPVYLREVQSQAHLFQVELLIFCPFCIHLATFCLQLD